MTFEIYFLIRFISKIYDDSSKGKMSFIWFHSVIVKGNWADLTKKNSRPRVKITAIFRKQTKKQNKSLTLIIW